MVCLPDVSVICTSSSERDLRFYDTTAQKFELRIMVTSMSDAPSSLYYKYYEDPDKCCKLLVGDMQGKIKVIEFVPKDRGPFQSKPGYPLTSCRWEEFVKVIIHTLTV